MDRFRNFVALVVSVTRAEFPNFEVLQTFDIFHLGARITQGTTCEQYEIGQRTGKAEHAASLCSCLKLDVRSLMSQLEDHRALAEKAYASKTIAPIDAWREAINFRVMYSL